MKNFLLLCFSFLVMFFILSCSQDKTDLNSPQNPDNVRLSKTLITSDQSMVNSDCKEYNFISEEWESQLSPFEDLVFIDNQGSSFIQLYYYGGTINSRDWLRFTLPKLASSISVDVCSYYNAVGSIIRIYDANNDFISETIPEDNTGWWADPVHVSIIPPAGKTIKYIEFLPKYQTNNRNQIFSKIEVCYLPECTQPTVTVNSSISEIWPPNNKIVKVNFTGNITNDCGGGEYVLTDEYREVNYTGTLPAGDFNIALNLIASRKGNDKDGRKYTFTVTAANDMGYATAQVDVVVLHDKRK